MALLNSPLQFGGVAKLFHWGMAIILIGMLALGLYMHQLPLTMQKFELYALHKSIGITALVLALLRLGWRAIDRPPGALPQTPASQEKLAGAAHWALYGLMIALPLSGWLMAAASATAVDWFNTGFVIPNPIGADDGVRITLRIIHDLLGKLLMAVVVIHVGAALKHHLMDKDATLRRMLPWGRT